MLAVLRSPVRARASEKTGNGGALSDPVPVTPTGHCNQVLEHAGQSSTQQGSEYGDQRAPHEIPFSHQSASFVHTDTVSQSAQCSHLDSLTQLDTTWQSDGMTQKTPAELRADAEASLKAPGQQRIKLLAQLEEIEEGLRPLVAEAVRMEVPYRRINELTAVAPNTARAWSKSKTKEA
ncbi:hypothetical protein J8N05_47115 (plasmid) [Streptomyces sp. BH-SS-21]|uniref:Uncharacterized protein n=1 Tax=Streptomyces liliiviolaceus TaxID=2823109 RepID=A0A941BEY2_9ACTN|nr:hypothetical protein [Streptomyces liliiviolaceus]MBQ0855733.1 hypothetical protein [Streptomyces liliiviolaceus]